MAHETQENFSSIPTAKIDAKYCPEIKCRWNNYNTYRFLIWAWMMNEMAIASAPVDISHNGFYIASLIYVIFAIFVGIPLVYSEICLAQYTNSNIITMWNFCPILRGAGYGSIYLIILKGVYMMVLSSWYFVYMFYSALSPPPWSTCDDYNNTKCMVKRINITVFQRCIETQDLFDDDCGMKTSSNFFFEKAIGFNNTRNKNCVYLWKALIAHVISSAFFLLVLIKRDKFVKFNVRILGGYIIVVVILLFCVALSTSGTWYASREYYMDFDNFKSYFLIFTQGYFACGAGFGIIGYLSRDVPFRSPATMTAVTIPLFTVFLSLTFALILYSAIKTVSFFHGEEENVLEIGSNVFFNTFASVAEILSYFDDTPLWTFAWFSSVYLCLFVNITILLLFMSEYVTNNIKLAQKYKKSSYFTLIVFAFIIAWPFYCCDLTVVLLDVTDLIQGSNCLLFSIGLYWVYGFQKHNVDIIFMIGVKASYFWKITWITNPLWLSVILYMKWSNLAVKLYDNSYFIESLSINVNELMVYILVGVYFLIVLVVALLQIKKFHKYDKKRNVFFPMYDWGPNDKILFRSRNMFVPEIMTREFLYRQVRIHGYSRKKKTRNVNRYSNILEEITPDKTEWSALTSN